MKCELYMLKYIVDTFLIWHSTHPRTASTHEYCQPRVVPLPPPPTDFLPSPTLYTLLVIYPRYRTRKPIQENSPLVHYMGEVSLGGNLSLSLSLPLFQARYRPLARAIYQERYRYASSSLPSCRALLQHTHTHTHIYWLPCPSRDAARAALLVTARTCGSLTLFLSPLPPDTRTSIVRRAAAVAALLLRKATASRRCSPRENKRERERERERRRLYRVAIPCRWTSLPNLRGSLCRRWLSSSPASSSSSSSSSARGRD